MNKLIKIIFVLGFLMPMYAHGQAVTWSKWFDYNNYENDGEDVIQTFDEGYLILVNNYVSNYSTTLIKTNQYGTEEWRKLIDHTVANGATITSYSVQQSKDSGYILAGESNGDSAFLLKTNKLGDKQWLRKYTKPGMQARFFDLKITMDGGIIACGDLFPPFNGYVVKTDSVGVVIWDSSYNTRTKKIIESPDSNFYLLSTGLMKLNSVGKKLWFTSFPAHMNSMVKDSSGYVYTAGSLDSVYLFKYDSSGTLVWGKRYYPGVISSAMCISKDQNILITGSIDTLIQTDIAVVKVNLNGDQIFKKKIETVNGNWFKIPYSVKPTNDYGFIFTGLTDFPGFPYNDNALAVKTDSLCYAPLIVGISNQYTFIPDAFSLEQNFPNPFNPSTTISYSIPKSGIVSIKIFDLTGKEIKTLVNEVKQAGRYEVKFDGSNLSSGVYFYRIAIHSDRIESGSFIQSRRMVLLK